MLAPQAADDAHPAFSKLFVETEFVAETGALLATRRRRSTSDPEVWAAHLAVVEGETWARCSSRPIARASWDAGAASGTPVADGQRASRCRNTVGAVLDPIFSLRRRVRLPARYNGARRVLDAGRGSRDEVLDLVDKHHDAMAFDRATTLAWTQAQVQLRHLGIDADEANLFQRLASHVLYADADLAAGVRGHRTRRRPPRRCCGPHGISGDLPIVLVRIDDIERSGHRPRNCCARTNIGG